MPKPSWREECVECLVAIQQDQQAHLEGMLEPQVSSAGSTGPDDTLVPSELDLDLHASGHVEYGEASCAPDEDGLGGCTLVFRDEAERLAFMD